MDLQYLVFDADDEASGAGSFDAMAVVRPDRVPALLAEVAAVLGWAHRAFGEPGAPPEDGEWDYDLQAAAEPGGPLAIAYDAAAGRVALDRTGESLLTVTLTLGGTPAFREAFGGRFDAAG